MALYCLRSAIAAFAFFPLAPSVAPAQVAGRPDVDGAELPTAREVLAAAAQEAEVEEVTARSRVEATLREAALCQREGITINIFLLSTWNQTTEDVRFAHVLAESTKGRVFFVAGRELDRYVVWDYVSRRKQIVA